MNTDKLRTVTKLNLGCGNTALPDYFNVDISECAGVDAVVDLTAMPWPLPDNHFTEVLFVDVLEHLPDLIATIEELWRVCKDGAEIHIRVPYWNSRWAWSDPQHKRPFHECTFDFFDPSKKYCQGRPYYSKARFKVEYVIFEGCWFFLGKPWKWKVPENQPRRILNAISKLCDIIHFLQFHLRVIK